MISHVAHRFLSGVMSGLQFLIDDRSDLMVHVNSTTKIPSVEFSGRDSRIRFLIDRVVCGLIGGI
jgi:hypothetical protein